MIKVPPSHPAWSSRTTAANPAATPRAGQIAPKIKVEAVRWSEGAEGRLPRLVIVPALYVAEIETWFCASQARGDIIDQMGSFVPALRQKIILPGCGHWTQQERLGEVNEAMISFLRGL